MLHHPTGRPTTGVILDFLRMGRSRPASVAAAPMPIEPDVVAFDTSPEAQVDRLGPLLLQAEQVRAFVASAQREVVPLGTGSELVLRFDGRDDAAAFQNALRQLCLMAAIYSRLQD